MGRLVLYIMEWAFALIILLTIYKAVFSGTTFYRFNRFYLLGATVLSALLPLVHITIPEKTPVVSGMAISDTEFAQELSGTFTMMSEPQMEIMAPAQSDNQSKLWAVILVCMYSGYVLMLMIGWIRSIIRARRFLRGKPRRRISRTVWLVTHDEEFGPFSWMNYIVISDTENGFARRASLRHEYSHVKLLHSVDLVFLLACTIFNPVCWLVLQEIKIVHEYEADHEVISHHGIHNGDYQKLLIMRTVGAEAYALASSFNLNIKKRINMLNKNQTRKRRLMWLLILIPALGITSVLFARSEKSLDINPLGITIGADNIDENTFSVKVVDENGKPVEGAMVVENPSQSFAVSFSFLGFTDKNGEFSFSTPDGKDFFSIAKEGYKAVKIRFENIDHDAAITLKKTIPGHEIETSDEQEIPAFLVKERNMMRVIVMKDGKVRVRNGVVDKTVSLEKKSGLPKLTEIVKQFVANPKNDGRLPIVEEYDVPGFKTVSTTLRHMISLEREPDASLDTRDAAYGIIANAYYELRDEWCRKEFGKTYDECTQEQQGYSRAMYATKILAPEMRYLCDVTIDVRKDALMAHVDRTDAKTGTPTDIRNALDYGRILNDVEELEDYINNVVDASSRLRSVKVRFYPGGSTDIVPDLKNMIMKKSAAVGIKYESVQDEEEDSDYMVVSQPVKAGDIITGKVIDVSNNDAPLMLVNVYEMDSKDRIRAASITDMNGEFSFRLVDPADRLSVSFDGYFTEEQEIKSVNFVRLEKQDNPYYELILEIKANGMEAHITENRRDNNGKQVISTSPQKLDDVGQLEKYIDKAESDGKHIKNVALNVARNVESGQLTDVKSALRNKHLLNIRYIGVVTSSQNDPSQANLDK